MKITTEITHEDDDYVYGNRYVNGEFDTTWCQWKKSGKPPVIIPAPEPQYTPEERAERIRSGRREYVATMKPKDAKKFIKRIIAEGYDLYGDDYKDILDA